MSTDIGPGDCVEAKLEMHIQGIWTATGVPYLVPQGARTVVVAFSPRQHSLCTVCREKDQPGLILTDYPLKPYVAWCPCEWRKVGGSKEEHLKAFAEYTRQRDDALIKELLGSPKDHAL